MAQDPPQGMATLKKLQIQPLKNYSEKFVEFILNSRVIDVSYNTLF